jgi:CBS domain-containing protein
MTPLARLHTVSPDENLAKVLQLMAKNDVNQLPVLRGHDLIGLVTRGDIMRYIHVREEVGEQAAQALVHPDGRTPADGKSSETSGFLRHILPR